MPDQHHRSILRPRSALSLAAIAVLVAILAGALTLAGIAPWSPPRELESFTIGYSAKQGEEVFILRPEANDGVRMLGSGRYRCCWEEAGSLSLYYNQPMPYGLRIAWRDESTGVIYRAETDLPEDLTARAARLPPVKREWDGRQQESRYLIVGVRADGSMTVWLSNAVREYRFQGRVLEKVAQAQGEEIAEEDVHP